ncbi:hypothetical protein QA640_32970 [Bradyrhizobium sp. CB82]|uniref:hypothetical protein n=1 Tax=Bradyrhizobium sp. CB82 TaxID=3039159 RepID=UPI0024B051D7|nr:hypothetical protein [Bradyrhizobium sp. CB82]WFU39158.1 hypothetical protein QA640_32970 [Bradyrhizobium sp. CB82]
MNTRSQFRSGAQVQLRAAWLAKAVALQTIHPLSATARDALFAYAMTGSAVASLGIIAAPHLEVLLRCVFHGRG